MEKLVYIGRQKIDIFSKIIYAIKISLQYSQTCLKFEALIH